MPRQPSVPRLTLHKASGQARIRHQGRDLYLGPYGDPVTLERYARFVAELAAPATSHQQQSSTDGAAVADPDLTISELILQFLDYAERYYGPESREPVSLQAAFRAVNELYGSTRAREFGPRALKAVRQHMIDVSKLSRAEINRRIGRIKRGFKWAVSEELIPANVFHGLQAVTGLRRGRSEARETEPIRPVAIETVEKTLPFLSPPVAAICRLQLLTGMRPSEVLQMRPADINCSDAIWIYTPRQHKTQYLGVDKQVPLGPKVQAILAPYLERDPEAYCFAPAEAERWRHEQRSIARDPNRKTKIYPCELRARERRRSATKSRKRKRPFQACYTEVAYRRAITYGIERAKKAGTPIPHWFPYQIRHTHGTEVRKRYGLEAAQVALGHSSADVTQVYAERNMQLATKVAQEIG